MDKIKLNLQHFAEREDISPEVAETRDGNIETTKSREEAETKTFTQAELESILAERLKREREKYKDYQELKKASEELQKLKEAQMTETEKLQAKLSEYEKAVLEKQQEVERIKTEAIKQKILIEMGLPLSLANRIFGTTEEEIMNDAKELKEMLGFTNKSIGSGTNPPNGGVKTFTAEQVKNMSAEEINQNWEVIRKLMAEGKLK